MTEAQRRIIAKLTEFVAPGGVGVDYPLSPEVQQEWVPVTRAECMELLGLIDRLRVKAEGIPPFRYTVKDVPPGEAQPVNSPLLVPHLKIAEEKTIRFGTVQDPATFEPTVPLPAEPPQVTPRDAELVREAIAKYPNVGEDFPPIGPRKPPFDGTYPTGQEKRAGAREQPPPNSGDQPQ